MDPYWSGSLAHAVWSPDSRYLVYAQEEGGSTEDVNVTPIPYTGVLYVLDVPARQLRRISPATFPATTVLGAIAPRWSPDGRHLAALSCWADSSGECSVSGLTPAIYVLTFP